MKTLFISLVLLAITQSADACKTLLVQPSRFVSAVGSIQNSRLDRFLTTGFARYASDIEVGALVKSIETERVVNLSHTFANLGGFISIKRSKTLLEIDIPTIQIETKKYGEVADGLNPRFTKVLTGLMMGVDRLVENHPGIQSVSISSPVVNEMLANILLDFGFDTPFLGRRVSREEVHFILTQNKVPPTLREEYERVWPNTPDDKKPLNSIPLVLEIKLP